MYSNKLLFYFSYTDKNRFDVRRSELFCNVTSWFGGNTNDGAHENCLRRHKTVGPRIQSNQLHASGKIRLCSVAVSG